MPIPRPHASTVSGTKIVDLPGRNEWRCERQEGTTRLVALVGYVAGYVLNNSDCGFHRAYISHLSWAVCLDDRERMLTRLASTVTGGPNHIPQTSHSSPYRCVWSQYPCHRCQNWSCPLAHFFSYDRVDFIMIGRVPTSVLIDLWEVSGHWRGCYFSMSSI